MIRINGKPRIHVPNRLAMLAALLLAVSAFTGLRAGQENTGESTATSVNAPLDTEAEAGGVETSRSRNFRLVLFRHG